VALSPLAGKPAPAELLIDVEGLIKEYYAHRPDPGDPQQQVRFGTSGHRGTPEEGTFTEAHILAISQAICDYRASVRISGPLFMGKDSHAVSGPAQRTALEVLAGNGVETMIQPDDGFTPTPVISHAILCYNRGGRRTRRRYCDHAVSQPTPGWRVQIQSAHGGLRTPASRAGSRRGQRPASGRQPGGQTGAVRIRTPSPTTRVHDFMTPYVKDLTSVIDMDCIRSAGIRMGADPLGGSTVHYWDGSRPSWS